MSSGVALSPIQSEPALSFNCMSGKPVPSPDESILIYLSVSGSVMPMRVLKSDSIESVK
jgi:hypothetical protein